ncbi:class I SAM-dependent methyltransferase [Acetobacterium bakii]|nr:class I SAM-dependent methyltransferase [Acetobacterium bakii]
MAVFDSFAKGYDEWYLTPLGKHVDEVEAQCSLNLFDVSKGLKVLDVGCGSGIYSMRLAELGYEVVGIDISQEMLKKAEINAKKRGLRITFLMMDVFKLNFEKDTFDGIFSMAAFEFIQDEKKAMAEMFRVLKKGGQIVIGTINANSEWGDLYTSQESKKNSVFKYANLKTLDEMKSLDPDHLVDYNHCLFISPKVEETQISMASENKLKDKGSEGGFICLKWIK